MIKSEALSFENITINTLENWTDIFGIELKNEKNLNILMDFQEVKQYLKRVGYNFILESDQVRWGTTLN